MSKLLEFAKTRSSRLEEMAKMLDKESGKQSYDDPRFWSYTMNKETKTGVAVIRFLPGVDFDQVPLHSHAWKNASGKWYFNNCPRSVKQNCPVCEHIDSIYSKYKGMGEAGKTQAGNEVSALKIGKKKGFIANILVVEDDQHPENVGKVFLYKYNTFINDKIQAALTGCKARAAFDPFDPITGANFVIDVFKTGEFVKYDKCVFAQSSQIVTADEEWEKIESQLYPLEEFRSGTTYKPYDVLKKKFDEIMGSTSTKSTSAAQIVDEENQIEQAVSKPQQKKVVSKAVDADDNFDAELDAIMGKDVNFDDDDIPF